MNNEHIGKNSLENIKNISNEKKFKKILIFAGETSYSKSGAESQLKTILSPNRIKFYYKITISISNLYFIYFSYYYSIPHMLVLYYFKTHLIRITIIYIKIFTFIILNSFI